ncbi:uncharacterized protein LOC111908484 isoform X1 [Lactuca sativa]|uniref:uncharacterized protein LOC111908484 isoform X1 n=1 Tax=Lactuca sativa TaxID=4236 RepID=UPI000CD90962|nr:uncharacterized protein LOC111908484 isoform X1 [Lactuca sativa]XP_042754908.1 uncharacterized protein LOC111908484 isoform X1 [Lactuca sativa]
MDVVSVILKPVVETLMEPVKKHLGYLIYSTKHVRDMSSKMRELNAARHAEEDHLDRNTRTRLEISSQVRSWLEEVEKINAKVQTVPSDAVACCSLKIRHTVGREAFKLIEKIESATRQHSLITWTDQPIPLGKVDTMKASSSTPSSDHDDFQSREKTFIQALKALEPNNTSHMIALCGMGGVGKTTMMQRLKKVAKENRMFSYIVEAVIGEKTDPIAIQQAVADYLRIELKESTKPARADKLREWFKANSGEGKNKFLVILDDVWQSVDPEDIGLSPFPNQGVDFKVLLTSRDEHICTLMGVKANSVINVGLLTEAEAQSLFQQFVETSEPELCKIGEVIVRKCCGLPIAIKTLACTLRNKRKDAWKDALSRIEHYDIRSVAPKVFETSYHNLQDEETKSIFLMCGLFPEDFNIPTEELMRYGWGLKIFDRVYTIREARNRLNTCIERLVQTNLLSESDDDVHVKMHDLVRAFVLGMYSEVEHASIVNHGNMPRWTENDITDSCKTISLTCKSMSEFPRDLKFPNLTILKLMHGDKLLIFPQDFYEGMKKLRVISYDEMKYPLLSSLPQCCTNLRVLHLHRCSLMMFDYSCIGNMLNLEVLSFAKSGIKWLCSTIGNLKKLRLLDLRCCHGLRIEKGVLKNLVKLEELYIGNASGFTDDNCNEMEEISNRLSALEFEFFNNKAQVKNMSFENLERFKISVGRSLDGNISKSSHSYENTLQLVTNKAEISDFKLNKLFVKTEVLCLSVDGMDDLEDVEVNLTRPPQSTSFFNLRVLVVSRCAVLRYLFKLPVANTLSNLERLEVCECDNMEELIHNGTGGSGKEKIMFPKLKFLSLHELPKLLGLCHTVNIIELPQLIELQIKSIPGLTVIYPQNKLETSSFLKEEFVIPKLETLQIDDMENLKEIWPYELNRGKKVKLREIEVRNCDKLVNLFPYNPMSLLHHLEELEVMNCGSIESLFNIYLDCASVIGEEDNMSSLRSIKVKNSGKLKEVWRIKDAYNSHPLVRGFQAVESIKIERCESFRNVFTPTTTNFDLGALLEIFIERGENQGNDKSEESSQEKEQTEILLEEETLQEVTDTNISNDVVLFPSSLIHSFHSLRKVSLDKYEGVEVVFEIGSPTSRELVTTHRNQQQPILPNLEELDLSYMDNMSHLWKCNWNKFFTLPKQQSESPFHNLTIIHIRYCKNIKYLFSPLMAELLSNLKKVYIENCDGIEEVVSNRNDEDEGMTKSTRSSTTLFPHLDSLTLRCMNNLKCIGGGGAKDEVSNDISFNNTATTTAFLHQYELCQEGGVSWSLCQYSREITIENCPALSSVIPCYAAGQMQKLQVLKITSCDGMKEVFETQLGMNNNSNKSGCDGGISRANNIVMLPNLNILHIGYCGGLEHIFTFPAVVESLRQLQELMIYGCFSMKVIVKKEEDASPSSSKEVVVFPSLKSIELVGLPELEGFFLGMNDFRLPSLEEVTIKYCPKMMVFAPGGSTAPQLKYIHTELGKYSLGESGLNFHVAHHQTPFPSLHGAISSPATSEVMPWSFHNLIELDVKFNHDVEKIIPSSEFLQLQKLEKITVHLCSKLEEVFETALKEAGRNRNSSVSGFDESSQTTTTFVNLLNLKQVELIYLYDLRYIWKSNQWTTFEFPNLTRVAMNGCSRLEHVFTTSMVGSLLQLQEIYIYDCKLMEGVIVKEANVAVEAEEESNGKRNEIVLPCLRSITLSLLPCLKGFSLGKEDFSFPLLDTLRINFCPAITTFTKGNSSTPHLKEIETRFSKLNSLINYHFLITQYQAKLRL